MEREFEYQTQQVESLVRRLARANRLSVESDGSGYTVGFRLYPKRNRRRFISVTIQSNEFLGDIEYKITLIDPSGRLSRVDRHYSLHNFRSGLEDRIDDLVNLRKMANSVIMRVAFDRWRLRDQG